jgi:hypothetical protein
MTLLLSYWALSALITHACLRGKDKADNKSNNFKEEIINIGASIIFGPFITPLIIYVAISFVFEYIDRSES